MIWHELGDAVLNAGLGCAQCRRVNEILKMQSTLILLAALAFVGCQSPQTVDVSNDVPMRLEAQLVRALKTGIPTDSDKGLASHPFQPADAATTALLGRHFKGKDFYELGRRRADVPKDRVLSVALNERGVAKLRDIGKDRLRLQLIVDGRQVADRTQKIAPGAKIMLPLQPKPDSVWIVAIQRDAADPTNEVAPTNSSQ